MKFIQGVVHNILPGLFGLVFQSKIMWEKQDTDKNKGT